LEKEHIDTLFSKIADAIRETA